MPVKNKNRQTNSGYEGVITGLNDEEKKVLEDAGIGGGSGGEILELNETDSNTVQFMETNKETTLTGVYDLNKTYKGFKITASGMERTFYFNAMQIVPAMNFKAYSAILFSIESDAMTYITYEIGITNNTISIVYKNESLPLNSQ